MIYNKKPKMEDKLWVIGQILGGIATLSIILGIHCGNANYKPNLETKIVQEKENIDYRIKDCNSISYNFQNYSAEEGR